MTDQEKEELQVLLEAAKFAIDAIFYKDKASLDQAMYMLEDAISKFEKEENND